MRRDPVYELAAKVLDDSTPFWETHDLRIKLRTKAVSKLAGGDPETVAELTAQFMRATADAHERRAVQLRVEADRLRRDKHAS